jgi:hypothetical protein
VSEGIYEEKEMANEIIIQLIIGATTIIVTLLGVFGILIRMLKPSNNVEAIHNRRSDDDDDLQRQLSLGTNGTKTLANRFDEQVRNCNERWLEQAESRGEIRSFMRDIKERLIRIEGADK